MKKTAHISIVLGIVILASGLYWASASYAGVSVGIGINLPAYRFAEPPELVLIPGTYAYTVPDAGVDIIFYHGYWYRPFEGRWYRGRGYNGPWRYIERRRVPGFFLSLPPDYRHSHAGYERIPYGHFRSNWRAWERDRYWDRPHRDHDRGREHFRGRDHDRGDRRDFRRDRDHGRGPERGDHERRGREEGRGR